MSNVVTQTCDPSNPQTLYKKKTGRQYKDVSLCENKIYHPKQLNIYAHWFLSFRVLRKNSCCQASIHCRIDTQHDKSIKLIIKIRRQKSKFK